MSENNYQLTPRNNTEERRSHVHRGGSL